MSTRNEMDNKELFQVAGGKLIDEAEEWLKANKSLIDSLARSRGMYDALQNEIERARNSSGVFTLDEFKHMISYYIEG